MKKLLLGLFLLFSVVSVAQDAVKERRYKLPQNLSAKDYLPNTVIVKFKPAGGGPKAQAQGAAIALKAVSVEVLKQKFPAQAAGRGPSVLKLEDKTGLNRIYELKFSGKTTLETVINEILENPEVEYAEPSFVRHVYYTPNDPAYTSNLQAYLNQIQAPLAWDKMRNSQSVVIGIVDSGSELTHPDLAANIYFNTKDPLNGVDDDGDGYVDNYQGWDFVGASSANIKEDNNPNITTAASEHGLHVSGIAGGVTDNSRGVASVSFNNGKLLIVKVGADDNGTDIYRGYEGIKYASDHGAQVINCSWGGESRSLFEQDVVNYVSSKGSLIVAAAGNSGSEVPQYPAGYEGVLAVANVQLNDVKHPSSNYGYYVSVSAPGSAIYSTTFSGQYGYKTGTSMASPVVAGAAALVKAYLPALSMQQVGEQLRITADNIDGSNPGFQGKMGKGRINVFRALTETPPSIRQQAITYSDKGSGTLPAGDTISIFVDLKNFLFPVSNLQVKLSSGDPNVVVTDAVKAVPFIGQLQSVSNVGAFKVYLKPGTPDNTPVQFRLDYTANGGAYKDFEGFTLVVARDYLNMQTNSIATTVTSKGRIGFLIPGVDDGTLGFRYKGSQLLYEAALMIGNSETQVSNSARSAGENYDDHFVKTKRIQALNGPGYLEGNTSFNDSGSPQPLNLEVKQRAFVFKTGNDQYLSTEYEIFNRTSTSLSNVYVGLFTDWDIEGGATNATHYDPSLMLAYAYDKKNPALPYAGVKLLTNTSAANYYPLSYMIAGDPLKDDFTIAEKYLTLSSGIQSAGLGETSTNGLDISFVTAAGPYIIPANGSIKVAFALLGADNLDQLKTAAAAAQQTYDTISPPLKVTDIKEVAISGYPNPITPATSNINLQIDLPEPGNVSLDFYNVLGEKVESLIDNQAYPAGRHYLVYNTNNFTANSLKGLNSGIYFYRLRINNKVKTLKVSVVR